ncbi:unnamed protein product [Strongylus vulgaris]|uniref:Uncharacterized protein n=1 Tax=Strongylus vulgaris TaxID=40348 RepID=A0A3P7JEQ5_STRVU|nr:unnamed protein product [Strongylus vulgaris]
MSSDELRLKRNAYLVDLFGGSADDGALVRRLWSSAFLVGGKAKRRRAARFSFM